jgi:hypothetical protein
LGGLAQRPTALFNGVLALQTVADGVIDQILETLHGNLRDQVQKKNLDNAAHD